MTLFLWCESLYAGTGFTLFFDEVGAGKMISDDSGNGCDMALFGKDAEITAHDKKFGEGSLLLSGERGAGIRQPLALEPYAELAGELSAMSISTWLRLPSEARIQDGFFLAGRTYERKVLPMLENEGETRGVWRWMFVRNLGFWFETGRGGKTRVDTRGTVTLDQVKGEWTHLVMTFDQGVVNFYVNASLVHTGVLPGGVTTIPAMEGGGDGAIWNIGVNVGYAHPPLPSGSHLDDFGYFPKKVLSEAEIEEIFNNGLKAFVDKTEGRKRAP